MTGELIQRILVPTDLSDFGKVALRWAAMFHQRVGARITLLYANQPYFPIDVIEGPAAFAMQNSPELRQRLQADLSAYAAENLPHCGSAVDTLLVDDDPARAILQTAAKVDADLILMATHARTGWRCALLGSITENVLHHSNRSVLTLPPQDGGEPKIATILCPVNFTDIARQALEEAVVLAAAFHAELLVVHVADLVDCLTHDEGDFAAWVEPEIRSRCKYSQIAAHGDAAVQVLKIAEQARADLIVIGAQHKRFSDATVIGTTTERVVRFAKRPVWTVVAPAEAAQRRSPQAELATA
jgi:nucleotide-binding universal stress UspA family protein